MQISRWYSVSVRCNKEIQHYAVLAHDADHAKEIISDNFNLRKSELDSAEVHIIGLGSDTALYVVTEYISA